MRFARKTLLNDHLVIECYYSLLAALECISTMGASALQLILHSSGMIEKQHLTLLVCYQHLKMSL